MANSKTFSYVLIFLLVIAAIFAAYKIFLSPDEGNGGVTVTGSGTTVTTQERDEFVDLLNALEDVEFNADTFLANPIFSESGLRDYSVELPVVEKGRNNPFAEIGAGGGTAKAATPKAAAPKKAGTTANQPANNSQTVSGGEESGPDLGITESEF